MCIVSDAKHSICLIFFLAETRHNWSNFKIKSFSSSNSSFPLLRKPRLRLRLSHLLPPSRSWRVAPCRQAPSTTPGPSSSLLLRVPQQAEGRSYTARSPRPPRAPVRCPPQHPTNPSAASPFRSSSSSRHCPREAAWSLPSHLLSRHPLLPFSAPALYPLLLACHKTSLLHLHRLLHLSRRAPFAQTPLRPSRPLPSHQLGFWCRCFQLHQLHHQWMHWGCLRVMAQCEYPQSSLKRIPYASESVQSSAS